MSPRPLAFAPDIAAPRRSLLWNGEGIGAATLVATPDGPVPAERLQRGGLVLGSAGRVLTLTEVRHVTLPAAAFRRLCLAPPVLIGPGALGLGMPATALLLGPAQRIRLEGGWVAAELLIDGQEVRREDDDARMVMLGLAEDTPLLAAGVMLGPIDTAPVDTARRPAVDSDAAIATLARQGGAVAGFVEHADRFGGTGWVQDCALPDRVVALEVVVAGTVVAQVLADRPRPDLALDPDLGQRGVARRGFAWRFAPALPAGRSWLVEVRRAGGGASLQGTPLLLEAAQPTAVQFDIALAGLDEADGTVDFLARLIANAASARRR